MKAIRIKMTDGQGFYCFWTVRRVEQTWLCGGNLKVSRRTSGWSFTDHEGCERFAEGNWQELVEMFKMVASNYGLKTNIS